MQKPVKQKMFDTERLLHFSIRKFHIGAASVAVAASLMFLGAGSVAANTTSGAPEAEVGALPWSQEGEGGEQDLSLEGEQKPVEGSQVEGDQEQAPAAAEGGADSEQGASDKAAAKELLAETLREVEEQELPHLTQEEQAKLADILASVRAALADDSKTAEELAQLANQLQEAVAAFGTKSDNNRPPGARADVPMNQRYQVESGKVLYSQVSPIKGVVFPDDKFQLGFSLVDTQEDNKLIRDSVEINKLVTSVTFQKWQANRRPTPNPSAVPLIDSGGRKATGVVLTITFTDGTQVTVGDPNGEHPEFGGADIVRLYAIPPVQTAQTKGVKVFEKGTSLSISNLVELQEFSEINIDATVAAVIDGYYAKQGGTQVEQLDTASVGRKTFSAGFRLKDFKTQQFGSELEYESNFEYIVIDKANLATELAKESETLSNPSYASASQTLKDNYTNALNEAKKVNNKALTRTGASGKIEPNITQEEINTAEQNLKTAREALAPQVERTITLTGANKLRDEAAERRYGLPEGTQAPVYALYRDEAPVVTISAPGATKIEIEAWSGKVRGTTIGTTEEGQQTKNNPDKKSQFDTNPDEKKTPDCNYW